MNQYKNIFLFILLVLNFNDSFKVKAQGFSYVYIQGDKKIPIYTKVEGVMLPRYGKNYTLISRLAPGPMNIEILFQQNEFPPLQFSILVPENGKRAFLLNKTGDEFSLYDIEQNFYLKPNNAISDDHLPTILDNKNIQIKTPIREKETTESHLAGEQKKSKLKENVNKVGGSIKKVFDKLAGTEKEEIQKNDSAQIKRDTIPSKFINNITFDNDSAAKSLPTKDTIALADTGTEVANNNVIVSEVLNSDCRSIIEDTRFERMQNTLNNKKTEDERLGVIIEACKQNCFSTVQAKLLVEKLNSDVAKYSALKSLYPKIQDQSNFSALEFELSSEDWREYFRGLIHK